MKKYYKIIINADDLGMSVDVNAAIERAINEGCISSSTIMANATAFDDAVRIAKSYPQITFGLHLNIDEFRPLTDTSIFEKYGMIDEKGSFKKEYLHNADVSYNDELLKAIYKEWKAQLSKVIDVGIIPSHLDSHEHTHGIFDLQPMLVRLMKEYGIKKVRRQPFSSMLDMVVAKLMHLNQPNQSELQQQSACIPTKKCRSFISRRFNQLGDARRHRQWIQDIKSENFEITDFFDGYQMFCSCYPRLYKHRSMETIELMTHPGHKGYVVETEMLMRKELQGVCQYELINYNQL